MTTKKDVLKRIGAEKFELDAKIYQLEKTLNQDPKDISRNQKRLMKVQFNCMQSYSEILGLRYDGLLDEIEAQSVVNR